MHSDSFTFLTYFPNSNFYKYRSFLIRAIQHRMIRREVKKIVMDYKLLRERIRKDDKRENEKEV